MAIQERHMAVAVDRPRIIAAAYNNIPRSKTGSIALARPTNYASQNLNILTHAISFWTFIFQLIPSHMEAAISGMFP